MGKMQDAVLAQLEELDPDGKGLKAAQRIEDELTPEQREFVAARVAQVKLLLDNGQDAEMPLLGRLAEAQTILALLAAGMMGQPAHEFLAHASQIAKLASITRMLDSLDDAAERHADAKAEILWATAEEYAAEVEREISDSWEDWWESLPDWEKDLNRPTLDESC